MNRIANIEKLSTRSWRIITDSLEKKIRSGVLIESGWAHNTYPGSWTYKFEGKFVQIQITDKTGFKKEAMFI